MQKQNIEQIVKQLCTEFYTLYPAIFIKTVHAASDEADYIAEQYWRERTPEEVERDRVAGVEVVNYLEWAQEALKTWKARTNEKNQVA